MKHLKLTSLLITVLGFAGAVIAGVFNLEPMWFLGGVMLAWAGIVKIVVVLIWTKLAKLGTEEHAPERGS